MQAAEEKGFMHIQKVDIFTLIYSGFKHKNTRIDVPLPIYSHLKDNINPNNN
jgi:hypothetical protein